MRQAIEAIKTTGMPSFVHIKCYRYLGHIGIAEDFDAGYRTRSEYEGWLRRDPLTLQRKRLLSQGWSEEKLAAEESRIDGLLDSSLRRAKEAPFPPPEELYAGVFNETT